MENKEFFISLARNRVPVSTQIELSRRCNWHCGFCYLGTNRTGELDRNALFQLMADLKAMGGLRLSFTGGEPFARKDALEIFRHAKSLGFVCEVNTNATLINACDYEEIANIFAAINISLHSSEPSIHDELVGISGAWETTVSAIRMLKKYSANITINSVITKAAVETYDRLKAFVINDLQCDWQPDTRISNTYSGEEAAVETYQVVGEDLADILKKNADLIYSPNSDSFCTGVCKAARNTCFIDVEGNVFPCLEFKKDIAAYPLLLGDVQSILNTPFPKIWWNNELLIRASSVAEEDFEKCMACSYYRKCFKCIAHNYFSSGNMTLPSDNICKEEQFYATFNLR